VSKQTTPGSRWQHDLKNQLGIVLGYSDLILEDLDTSHPLREDLEEIQRAAQHAMALVTELDETS
jgi:signal transduction histidine kinase